MSEKSANHNPPPKIPMSLLFFLLPMVLLLLQPPFNVCEATALSSDSGEDGHSPEVTHEEVIAQLDRLDAKIKRFFGLYGPKSTGGKATSNVGKSSDTAASKSKTADDASAATTEAAATTATSVVDPQTTTTASDQLRSIIAGASRCEPGEIYYLNHCRPLD